MRPGRLGNLADPANRNVYADPLSLQLLLSPAVFAQAVLAV
jgi:hypothetical protein